MASRNTPGTTGAKLTKEERRKQAREAARLLQIEEAKRAKRNRIMVIIGVIVALALVATAVFLVVSNGKKAQQAPDFTPAASVFVDGTPANVNDQGGISVGADLVAGTANEGAPTVTIYFDYLCSWCNHLEASYGEELTKMAQEGKITLVYQPVVLRGQQFSNAGAIANFFLAENAPDKYLAFSNAIFSQVTGPLFTDASKESATEPTVDQLIAVATEVGVPADVVANLQAVLADGSYQKWVDLANSQMQANQLSGTPRVIIDGKELADWDNGNLTTYLNELIEG
ncbi:MAG: thioredoxin domain-containing protein [Ancrocorticia sp.]